MAVPPNQNPQMPGSGQYSVPGQNPESGQMPFPPPLPPPGQGYVYMPVQGWGQDYNQPYYPQANIPMSQDYASNYGYGSTDEQKAPNHGKIKHMDTFQLFSDADVRRAFIRKVYTVLTLQLMFTTGLILIFIMVEPVKLWIQKNIIVYYLAFGVFFMVYLTLVCCEGVRRKFPTNYICLFIFTLSMSYMTGVISSMYETTLVFIAFAMTAALTLCITLFAIFTKIDFTKCSAFIMFISLAFMIFGIACMIVLAVSGPNKTLSVVYAGVGLVVFSIFLCFDTQLILGGRTHAYSEEDYIVAVVQIYLDIVYIFLELLTILGLTGRD